MTDTRGKQMFNVLVLASTLLEYVVRSLCQIFVIIAYESSYISEC